ncbi:hypothetical protein XJ44_02180 [Thermosipho affectus]|uniref:Uncharacterized protein n=1 Tax=Thermosipho affectus TaxID=660294 RepID=A0ABX3IIZ1_9BACT|nr:hypothetical protein [Thermosipho affectus]ONN27796.1 hypothetical protein XJ44_02180 [Thermosipho affectus]
MKKIILILQLISIVAFSKFSFFTTNYIENLENGLQINLSYAFGNWQKSYILKGDGPGRALNPAESGFYIFEKIPPYLNFEILFQNNNFVLYTNIPFSKETTVKIKDPFLNFSFTSFDMNGPENFLLGYLKKDLFIGIGRYPIKWGDSKYPITISDTTFQDNLTISKKFENFTYTYHFISSFPLLTKEEKHIQENYYEKHTPNLYFFEPFKTIVAHRFEFFLDDFRIAIGELNVVGGKAPDLIDLNPLMFFHNTYGEGYSNVLSSVDFSYSFKNLKIFGEFALDDYITPTETEDYKPNAYGYNLGIEFNLDNFNIWFEYDFTSEWMYITNYLPYLRINVRHFYLDNNNSPGRALADFPLGFRYGPDATMVSMGGNYKIENLKISFTYNFLVKGTVNDDGKIRWKWFWDAWNENVSPQGIKIEKSTDLMYNIIDLLVVYNFFKFNIFKVNDNILFIFSTEVKI